MRLPSEEFAPTLELDPPDTDRLLRMLRALPRHLTIDDLSRALLRRDDRPTRTGAPSPDVPLIGTSAAMLRLHDRLRRVSPSRESVLICGESGTGKELVAKTLHALGPEADGPFVPVDCGALPEQLAESLLFGHGRGAFTGADRDRVGLLEEANGGTLFLDEISNTSLALQAKLLRALQEGEIRRVGETRRRRLRVRVVAATNVDPMERVRERSFRADLYYRIAVVTLRLPPLRDRGDDVALLASHFLDEWGAEHDRRRELTPPAIRQLMDYAWPGNVRELRNVVRAAATLADGRPIEVRHLPDALHELLPAPIVAGVGEPPAERILIERTLLLCSGNKTHAADRIGWSRNKLYRRMRALGVPLDYARASDGA